MMNMEKIINGALKSAELIEKDAYLGKMKFDLCKCEDGALLGGSFCQMYLDGTKVIIVSKKALADWLAWYGLEGATEMLMFVLIHENRHLQQFKSGAANDLNKVGGVVDSIVAEADADAYARRVLGISEEEHRQILTRIFDSVARYVKSNKGMFLNFGAQRKFDVETAKRVAAAKVIHDRSPWEIGSLKNDCRELADKIFGVAGLKKLGVA